VDDLAEAVRRNRSYAKVLLAAVGQRANAKNLGGKSTGIIVAPGGAQGLVAIGAAKFLQGRFKETITNCDAAIQLKPGIADAFLLRGASLIGEGDIERGIADLKEASRLDR
jgi:tetratricopeptide (TPR) repeat protein